MTRTAAISARLAVAFVLSAASASANAQIFQPGTQPVGKDGGISAPLQSAEKCSECHGDYDDESDDEPWDVWRGSMMANAARDLVFRAALAIAEKDNADAADFCVRCHSMPAWLRGRSSLPEWSEADGPRFLPDDRGFLSSDLDGVTCAVCHQVDEDAADPDAPYLQNAQLHFLDGDEATVSIGPYEEDPEVHVMHPARKSTFLASGDFCGQCHDITNPVVMGRRADGSETGRPVALERTYSEWKHSDAAANGDTCQTCHMPEVDGARKAANDGPLRDYFRRHELVGANTWMPAAIAAELPDNTDLAKQALARTGDLARASLAAAATVEIRDVSLEGDVAGATVRVTNKTGHKLPTGYPEGRRMWLEITVLDADGTVLTGSGRYDAESHELEHDAAERTYEVKLGVGDSPSFHFIQNDTRLEDTRIPPKGFAAPAELDMEPVGRDYGDGNGGYRGYDDASYVLPVCGEGPARIRARLRFQTTTKEYIEFLRDHAPDSLDPNEGNWGARAYDAWLAYGGAEPVDMAEAEVDLGTLTGKCPGKKGKGGGCALVPGLDSGRGGLRGGGLGLALLSLTILALRRRRRMAL